MRRSTFAVPVAFMSVLAPLSISVSSMSVNHHASAPAAHVRAPRVHETLRLSPRAALARTALVELKTVAMKTRHTVPQLRAEWQQVAICEVGGNWAMVGSWYSGIGFLNSTWNAYGGTRFAPLAGRATRDQQIVIGMRVTGGYVPDQNGCSPGGW